MDCACFSTTKATDGAGLQCSLHFVRAGSRTKDAEAGRQDDGQELHCHAKTMNMESVRSHGDFASGYSSVFLSWRAAV